MIVAFGSINLDLTATVERLPEPGETISGASFSAVPGGKGANQAIAARRAGAQVAMVGRVGTDAFAAPAMAGLIAAGVDTAGVERVDAPTGVALINVDARGRNSITVIAGANDRLGADAVPDAAVGDGVTLLTQLEVPVDAVTSLALRARRRGARVVLNAAPARAVPAALLESLDALIVNEHEAKILAGTLGIASLPEEFATALARRSRCGVIVTLGSHGALAARGGACLRIPAPSVPVVDTTGAGDAFVGALAAAIDRGERWERALCEGVAAGSLACGKRGAQAGLPDAAAIGALADKVESGILRRLPD
jgi:ribokinase